MDWGMALQLAGSALAIALLVGLAAWAGLARPTPALDPSAALGLLAEEFPDHAIDALWIADDGAGLIARSGGEGLVLWRRGDGYVARAAPWPALAASRASEKGLSLTAVDGAPKLQIQPWPPAEAAA